MWDNALQRLEAAGIEITWENFKTKFLEKYFPIDAHGKKETMFLDLKRGNMTIAAYEAKFEELSR